MATDTNLVVLVGRLTRDAELKYTPNGTAVADLSLAVNRSRKNGDQWVEEANFFDIALMGRSAESLSPYLKKGTQIAVSGELRQDRWQQDGQNRSKVSVFANRIQLLGGKGAASASGGGSPAFASQAAASASGSPFAAASVPPAASGAGVIPDDFDDDIPF